MHQSATGLQLHMFACLDDNYGYLLHDPDTGDTAAIDTPDADAIDRELARLGWCLTDIYNTHHHADHTGGNMALKRRHGCRIHGPGAEARRIPGLDRTLADGDCVTLGGHQARILHTPGHTRGHIVYHFSASSWLMAGDTLFSLGCGRLFEGSAEQMWQSLQRLRQLPEQTLLWCAHEYTQANARFALTLEPDNKALQTRAAQVDALRASDRPTLPSSLRMECDTNPFLRPHSTSLRQHAGLDAQCTDIEAFAWTRALKDRF